MKRQDYRVWESDHVDPVISVPDLLRRIDHLERIMATPSGNPQEDYPSLWMTGYRAALADIRMCVGVGRNAALTGGEAVPSNDVVGERSKP